MANQKDLDFTYTTIDKIFRISIGETADFSGAKYDGDFSMTLEEAQKQKERTEGPLFSLPRDARVRTESDSLPPTARHRSVRSSGMR